MDGSPPTWGRCASHLTRCWGNVLFMLTLLDPTALAARHVASIDTRTGVVVAAANAEHGGHVEHVVPLDPTLDFYAAVAAALRALLDCGVTPVEFAAIATQWAPIIGPWEPNPPDTSITDPSYTEAVVVVLTTGAGTDVWVQRRAVDDRGVVSWGPMRLQPVAAAAGQ